MFGKYRSLASFLIAGQMLLLPASALQAQDAPPSEETEIIGPRELRGFQLPGSTNVQQEAPRPETPGPPTEPGDPTSRPAPVTVAPPPVAAPAEAASDATTDAATDAVESAAAPASGDRAAPAEPTDEAPSSAPARTAVSRSNTGTTPSVTGATVPVSPGPALDVPAAARINWSYVLAALVLALLGFGGYRYLSRQGPAREEFAIVGEELPLTPAPAARPARPAEPERIRPARAPFESIVNRAGTRPAQPSAPATGNVVGIQLRPWLQLEFTPERVAATATETTVQYELIIRNTGNAVAKDVRIEGAIFNAGVNQDREIRSFFGRGVGEKGARVLAIPPRGSARLRNHLTMPKEEVREITIEGRRLFIPMVAFNAVYEWGDGKSGQTSMSYLVGRETEKSSDKMAAFRLDLGPRIYRTLGTRQSETVVLV